MKRIILLLLIGGALLFGQEQTESSPEEPIDETQLILNFTDEVQGDGDVDVSVPSVGFGDFLRIFLFLALVIALIYLFFYFLKKISGRENNPQDLVNVLATQNLRNDHVIYLVEVGKEVMLLGGGSGQLSLIKKISDEETLDELKLKASQENSRQGNSFMQFLQGKTNSQSKNSGINIPLFQNKKDRLNKL